MYEPRTQFLTVTESIKPPQSINKLLPKGKSLLHVWGLFGVGNDYLKLVEEHLHLKNL